MSSLLRPALSLLLLLSLITGVAYPLLVTGIAQVAFPAQANGSLIRDAQGQVRGSRLIAQPFDAPGWFVSRPSAGAYATVASAASNLAPSNPALASRVQAAAQGLYHAALGPVPLALLTTSASGLDPHLPPAAVAYQLPAVAAQRQLPAAQLQALVAQYTETPLVGPPVVNILAVNLALDQLPSASR